MAPEHVFKTLVARGDRTGVLLAVIAAKTTLDSGNRSVEARSRRGARRKCWQ
jgi:prolyl-tRNA editing enzyme YbaK/EbsC (Cys-tRNA(Pro) deacylase)